jgi:uncharacterized membrane protein
MKLGVCLLLSSFGTFWAVEGLGGEWPGSEFAVLYIATAYSVAALLAVRLLVRPQKGTSDDANADSGMSRTQKTPGKAR